MATRTPASKAVVATTLTPDQLVALLQQSGAVSTARTGINRMQLQSGMLTAGDDTFVYNPSKPEIPALVVRITRPIVPYFAFFFASDEGNGGFDASRIGRPELNGQFCKRYEDANEQALDTTPANEVYDQVKALLGKNGSYKADIHVQIVPDSGEMVGDEPVWVLALSTTSVFEFRGTSSEPEKGLVSESNFMVDLATLAMTTASVNGADELGLKTAVLNALTSYQNGGVVAEVRLLKAQNKDKTNTWVVVNFRPIHIEDMDGAPALETGDVPF